MASVISVLAKISANTSSFVGGMKSATKAAESFQAAAVKGTQQAEQQANANMSKLGNGAIKLGTIVKGALVGVLAIQGKQFLQGAIQQASNFEAEFEGVNQVFGAGAKIVQDYAANAAKTAGLSETTALKFAKSFGGYAKSAGLAGDEMGNFATGMVQAAGDLGSFFDLPTESALMAIQQGLRGEYEPLRRFNILLDESSIGARAMADGISSTGKNLTQQEKILVRQKLIMEGLGVAQGDYVKYSDTYGNSIKTVGALMQDLQKDVGLALLPSLAKLAQAFMPLIEKIAPILAKVIEKLAPIFETVAKSMDKLLPALDPVLNTLGILADIVVDILDVALEPLIQLINMVAPILEQFAVAIKAVFEPLLAILKPLIQILLVALIPVLGILSGYLTVVTKVFEFLGEIINELYEKAFKPLWEAIMEAGAEISAAFEEAFGMSTQELLEEVMDNFIKMWRDVVSPIINAIVMAVKWLTGKIKEYAPKIKAAAQIMFGWLSDVLKGLGLLRDATERPYSFVIEASGVDTTTLAGILAASGGKAVDTGKDDDTEKPPPPAKNPIVEFYKKLADEIAQQKARVKLASMGLNEDLISQIVGLGEGWQKVYNYIVKSGGKGIKDLESKFAQTAAGFAKIADAVKGSMASIRDSIMSGFSLTGFGKSSKQVLVNARRMVEKAKQFGEELVKLAKMNLNPILRDQIMAAGPVEGLALAKSLTAAGQPTIDELNSLYNQAGSNASAAAAGVAKTQTNFYVTVTGGVGDKATIGKAIVEAVKAYERQNGKVFS